MLAADLLMVISRQVSARSDNGLNLAISADRDPSKLIKGQGARSYRFDSVQLDKVCVAAGEQAQHDIFASMHVKFHSHIFLCQRVCSFSAQHESHPRGTDLLSQS